MSPTTRYKLTLEYDGTNLAGWQHQNHMLSLQQLFEEALESLFSSRIESHVAGRTDAGVHALGQVVHVDLPKAWPTTRVQKALNDHLRRIAQKHYRADPTCCHLKESPLAVLKANKVNNEFHARFSATKRHYLYRIIDRKTPSVCGRHGRWHVHQPLNIQAMRLGASYLIGKHDFTSFRAAGCQASSAIKTLDRISLSRSREEIHIKVEAPSFLYHQVRNIVGTLVLIGIGKTTPESIKDVLEAKNRKMAGPTAPACGLYLTKVVYGKASQ